GPADKRLSAGIEGSSRIGEPLYGMAEMQLKRAPRVDELPECLGVGEAGQCEVVDGVRADLDSALLEDRELGPGEEARVGAGDSARDHVRDRVNVEPGENRRGLTDHIALPVVE